MVVTKSFKLFFEYFELRYNQYLLCGKENSSKEMLKILQ